MRAKFNSSHFLSWKRLSFLFAGTSLSLLALFPGKAIANEMDPNSQTQLKIEKVTIGNKGCSKSGTEIKIDQSKLGFKVQLNNFKVEEGKEFSDPCEIYVEVTLPARNYISNFQMSVPVESDSLNLEVVASVVLLKPNQGLIKESDWMDFEDLASDCSPQAMSNETKKAIIRVSLRLLKQLPDQLDSISTISFRSPFASPMPPDTCGTKI